jgi:hypothetical protein
MCALTGAGPGSTLRAMSEGGGARSKRFGQEMDPEAQRLNASIGFDWRLLEHDAAGTAGSGWRSAWSPPPRP